ncbi:MAG TPA: hypothetical protein VKJ01_23875, partial [Candidatus Solibacter sp.]|nr:hypothetical protein [Candidatus Solibacter sp.]
ASMIAGIPKTGNDAVPYKKSDITPNLGGIDESDDIRGGMGFEGLQELGKFVQQGGTLISEGSTAALMAEFDLSGGVTVEHPEALFARGTILRGKFADLKSPIAYGYDGSDLPVYFNQDPVLNAASGGGGFGGFGGGGGGRGGANAMAQNVTPNAVPIHISPLEAGAASAPEPVATPAGGGRGGRGGGFGGGGFGGDTGERPRVVLQFPANANDMLLSGTLAGGEAIANRALAVDVTLGQGHIVMFALRPFWRWQTQGTYFLAFNAILNWNHLDAGKAPPPQRSSTEAGQN